MRANSNSVAQAVAVVSIAQAVAGILAAVPAVAQTSSSQQSIEEIVVTAQKRSESIQDVPIAISVLKGAELSEQHIVKAEDLIGTIPNLSVQSTLGDLTPIFSIRGITAWDYSPTQPGPIGIYYDEAYKGNVAIQGVNYFDLERVEVLRGPQGTLYGRNTTGGAINFVSKVPEFRTDGYLKIGYGNYNHRSAEGAFETPISDTLAVRIAGTGDWADGWLKNIAPGQPNLSSTDQYALRGTLLYKPSENFDLTIRASLSRANPTMEARSDTPFNGGTGSPFYPAYGADGQLLLPYPVGRNGLDIREVDNPHVTHRTMESSALSATAHLRLSPELMLTSISTYDYGRFELVDDADGAPIQFTLVGFNGNTKQITQDLRLTSSFRGAFNFIAGLYYLREQVYSSSSEAFALDVDVNRDGTLSATDCATGGFFVGCFYTNSFDQTRTSYAAYTDGKLDLTESLKLDVGLRFTKDEGRQYNMVGNILGGKYSYDETGVVLYNNIPRTQQEFADNNVSGKIGVEYRQSNNLLLYANVSNGYRGSNFNAQALFSPLEVTTAKPEKITSEEAGFKWRSSSGGLIFNGALFNSDLTNTQYVDFNATTFASPLVNLPKSRIRGAEFDLTARLLNWLTFNSSVGILDTEVLRGTSQGVDITGKPLINSSRVTASSGVTWRQPISTKLNFTGSLNGSYRSRANFSPQENPITSQEGYFLLNGNLRLSQAEDAWGVTVWAKNLTNKVFFVDRTSAVAFGNYEGNVLGPPRTFGISVDVKF